MLRNAIPRDLPTAVDPTSVPLVSIGQLIARDVRFEWYEALAIVQSLCGVVLETPDETTPVTLEAGNVYLAVGGDVMTIAGPQPTVGVTAQVAQLFAQLLPDFHRRATFHEVIATATGDPPGFSSLYDLSRALEPFERPHRQEIVQAVYQRVRGVARGAADTAVRPALAAPSEPARVAPPTVGRAPARVSPSVDDVSGAPSRRFTAVALLLGAAIVVGGFSAWLVLRRPDHAAPVPVEATVDEPATQPGPSSVPPPGDPTAAAVRPAVAPSPSPVRPILVVRGHPATPTETAGLAPPPEPARQTTALVAAVDAAEPPEPASPAADAPVQYRFAEPPTYTVNDSEVTPPKLEYQQQVWHMPATRRGDDLAAIEIVVNERGEVESAKAVSMPATIGDALAVTESISAAKTWRFRPALKDGTAVRYRQVIAITVR